MADKIISLSPELLAELKGLIVDARNQRPTKRPIIDLGDLHQASDTYIARAPEGGIPATDLDGSLGSASSTSTASGVVVGHADCNLYHLYDDGSVATLLRVGKTERVYNLSTTEVEADAWVIITKTKSGPWFVVGGTGGESPTSNCDLAKLKSTDCLEATSGSETTLLENNGSGHWISNTDIDYGYGTGELEFWFSGPIPHLSLSGRELMWCGNGCWSGGELTGHISGTGSSTGTGECDGGSLQVCLKCTTCVPPLAPLDGCCDVQLPTILHATVTCPDCPTLDGVWTLRWTEADTGLTEYGNTSPVWFSDIFSCAGSGTLEFRFGFSCSSGRYGLGLGWRPIGATGIVGSGVGGTEEVDGLLQPTRTCDPLWVNFLPIGNNGLNSHMDDCCTDLGIHTFTAVITE